MSDPGPQKGPASTARINAQTKAVAEAMKCGALTVGVDWDKGDSVSRGPSPLMKAAEIARDIKRLQEANQISYLCMTKEMLGKIQSGLVSRNDVKGWVEGLPIYSFLSEFECVLFMRVKHAADGSKGLLVKGPDDERDIHNQNS